MKLDFCCFGFCAMNIKGIDKCLCDRHRMPSFKVFALEDLFFFSSRRRHTRSTRDWSSDVCSSDLRQARKTEWPVSLGLATEEGFPHQGTVNFVDNQVNPKTGTLRVRGVFPNKDESLAPGFFARVREIGRASCRERVSPSEVDEAVK